MMLFSSRHPGLPSCSLTKVSWRKWYCYATRFMRDSLLFAFLFTEHIDSHQGAVSIPGGLQSRSPSIGCHKEHEPSSLSLMTGANWEPSTGCIHFKPQSFSLPFFYHNAMGNLGRWYKDTNHKMIRNNTKMWERWKYKLNLNSYDSQNVLFLYMVTNN